MTETILPDQQISFQLKASFLPSTVLQLMCYDLDEIEQQLMTTIHRAPNLFIGSPVIVDLDKIKNSDVLNFSKIKDILVKAGLVPIGVRGGSAKQHEAACDNFPILSVSKLNASEADKKKKDDPYLPQAKIVSNPIRSGMQVYAKDTDLIVTASVSPGAELFADGNIHVYGVLRGRALAGVQGNMQARIFCRTLEAELVSIAGYYLTKEDIQNLPGRDGMVQIYLDKAQVRIEAI